MLSNKDIMNKTLHTTYLVIIFLGFSSPVVRSQEAEFPLRSAVRTLELRNLGPKTYADIDGTPYYSQNYIDGVVYLKNGNYASLPLRYDIFADEIEFKKDNKTMWLLKKDIKYVRYGTDMIFVSSADGDTTRLGYYFLKDNGKLMLFFKRVILYHPMVEPKGFTAAIPERFEPDKNLIYIKKDKMPAEKILTKKDLTSFFSDDPVAMEYIKKNKVRPDDLEAIHQLVISLNNK
jgi:hypothetical protein